VPNLGVAIVEQYERAVVFRLGKIRKVRDPGIEEIRELDSGIGADGVATRVTVTDAVTIDTDHDGVPNAAEVTTVIMHPAPRAADQPDLKERTR